MTSCFSVSSCLDQNHADSILAIDASTGQIKWAVATQSMDVYNHSLSECTNPWSTSNGQTCPQPNPNGYGPFAYDPRGYGPNGCGLKPDPTCNTTATWDYDLGAGPNLFTARVTSQNCGIRNQSTLIVGVGSKSGTYTALDAATGCLLWNTNIGPGGTGGGVEFGTATDGQRIYLQERAPVSLTETVPYQIQESDGSRHWITSSSLAALDPATGSILWQAPDPAGTYDLIGPPTVANGVVYTPSLAGYMYAFDASTGDLLWTYPSSAGGSPALGGAAIVDGAVYWPNFDTIYKFSLDAWDQGIDAQLSALPVTGVGTGTSLADKVTTIESNLAANDSADTCGTLAAFINQVKAQTPHKITPAQADSLTPPAQTIQTELGC
jgi:polyvinyl alcohol dehydrogenase (cytochrome)